MKDRLTTIAAIAGLFFCMAFSINLYMSIPEGQSPYMKMGVMATAILSACIAAPCILLLWKKKK